MIEAASQAVDRVYRIRVTDNGPGGAEPPVFSDKNGRKPGIDGAELFVRGSDKFVLIRHFGRRNGLYHGKRRNPGVGRSAPGARSPQHRSAPLSPCSSGRARRDHLY